MRARIAWILFFLALGCSKPSGPEIPTVAPDAFEKPSSAEPGEPVDPTVTPVAAPVDDADVAPRVSAHHLKLPADGGAWPIVAAAPATGIAVSLTPVLTKAMHVRGAAVSPKSGRAVVLAWESDSKQKKDGTHVFWCDLKSGKVTHTWDASRLFLQAFDMHADGRQFLARRHDGTDRDRHTLELWTISEDGALRRKDWDPYYTGQNDGDERENDGHRVRRAEAEVRWAAFAGRDHIVTVCGGGEMKVWERESLKQVALVNGVVGVPTVANDGRHVAFVMNDRVALFDPTSMKVIAARRIGPPPEHAALAFRADGKRLAIGGTSRAIIVSLEGDAVWSTMLPEMRLEYHDLLPGFGWIGEGAFYCRGDLYDMQLPIKVWHYGGGSHWSTVRGGQVWAVTQALGDRELVLRAYNLPHARAEAAIRAASQDTSLFALRPGDSVRVDVGGVPANRQKEVRETLERRAKELGYRLDSRALTVFTASVDATGKKVTRTYTVGSSQVTGTYNERHARLKIVKNGRVLWETSASDSPGWMIFIPNNTDPAEHISRYGSPNYDMFAKRPLPGLLRADRDLNPLGHSQLAANGIRD